jgi:Sec-independent protein secretion pathway component TatC
MAGLAVALPGVDPITTAFEIVPLMLLFEGSIWLSVVFERRWRPEFRTPLTSAKT